MTKTAIKT